MNIKKTLSLLLPVGLLLLFASTALCGPIVYRIKIDPKDASGLNVEITARSELRSVQFAMAAHPEYHDRYFRYVENFSAESGGRKLSVTNPEEAVWQVDGVRGTLTVLYRISPPSKEREWRQTWKPFVTPTGGLVGDLHTLMYIVGEEKHPALLKLDMPPGWKAVSGLEPTDDPRTFAGTVELLLDSPVMIGEVRDWKFTAGDVPHTVAIWSPPDAKPVDAAPIVEGVQKLTKQAIKAFGKPPYPRYAFLLENGGQAALEHRTSLSAGISLELNDLFEEIAHEYVHVWNLMDVRPRERIGLKHKFAEPTGVLWWSEGATIMFADMLIRRARLPGESRTRLQRLESSIARYLTSPGYYTMSAEQVSRGDSHPILLGDNFASTHLQGEVLSVMLDLKIRDVTDGRRNIVDVMRLLARRFDFRRGITNSDIESAIGDVCNCDIQPFFREYIYGAKKIDFDHYLGLMGVRSEITHAAALGSDGRPLVDLRIGPMPGDSGSGFTIRITNSQGAWGRAGLHTGDRLVSVDGSPVSSWPDLRAWLRKIKIGDTGRLEIIRDGVTKIVEVPIMGYDVPTVKLSENPNSTPRQIRLRNAWMNAH